MKNTLTLLFYLVNCLCFGQVDSVVTSNVSWIKAWDSKVVHESDKYLYIQVASNDFGVVDKEKLTLYKSFKLSESYRFYNDIVTETNIIIDRKKGEQKIEVKSFDFDEGKKKSTLLDVEFGKKKKWTTKTNTIFSPSGNCMLVRVYSENSLGSVMQNFILNKDLSILHTFNTIDHDEVLVKIDDDASVYLFTEKGSYVCYNSAKEFEKWEQRLIDQDDRFIEGVFSSLKLQFDKEKINLSCYYTSKDSLALKIKISIDYYSKEVGELTFKDAIKVELKEGKKGLLDGNLLIEESYFSYEKLLDVKYTRECGVRLKMFDEGGELIYKHIISNIVKREGQFSVFGIAIDSNRIFMIYNIHLSDYNSRNKNIALEGGDPTYWKLLKKDKDFVTIIHGYERKSGKLIVYRPIGQISDLTDRGILVAPSSVRLSNDGKYLYLIAESYKVKSDNHHLIRVLL